MWCVCCFRPRRKKVVDVVEYDSDDERKYEKEAVPDPTQDDYYHDAVDDFHAQKDQVCAVNWHCGFQKWQCAFLKSSFFIFYKLKMMMWILKQKLISKEWRPYTKTMQWIFFSAQQCIILVIIWITWIYNINHFFHSYNYRYY